MSLENVKRHRSFKFDRKIKNKFVNTFKFLRGNLIKSALLLWKRAYPSEYWCSWAKFEETSSSLR